MLRGWSLTRWLNFNQSHQGIPRRVLFTFFRLLGSQYHALGSSMSSILAILYLSVLAIQGYKATAQLPRGLHWAMNPAMRPGTARHRRHRLEPSVDPVKANAEHSRWCCWSPTVRFPCSVGNALQACKNGWSSSISIQSIPSNSGISSMKPGVDMCRPMGQRTCSANYT